MRPFLCPQGGQRVDWGQLSCGAGFCQSSNLGTSASPALLGSPSVASSSVLLPEFVSIWGTLVTGSSLGLLVETGSEHKSCWGRLVPQSTPGAP